MCKRPNVHSGASAVEQTEWAWGAGRGRPSAILRGPRWTLGRAAPPSDQTGPPAPTECEADGRGWKGDTPTSPGPRPHRPRPPHPSGPPPHPTCTPHHSQRTPASTSEEPHVFLHTSQRAPDGRFPSRQWWWCVSCGGDRQWLGRPPARAPRLPPGSGDRALHTHVVPVPVPVALAAVAAGEGHTVGVNVQLTHWGVGRGKGLSPLPNGPCPLLAGISDKAGSRPHALDPLPLSFLMCWAGAVPAPPPARTAGTSVSSYVPAWRPAPAFLCRQL